VKTKTSERRAARSPEACAAENIEATPAKPEMDRFMPASW
jgi:hypothetical protein